MIAAAGTRADIFPVQHREIPMTRAIIDAPTLSAYAKARGIQASPAVRVGDLIFVSGFPPFGEGGEVVPASIERQTEIVLDHMRDCLEAAGSCLAKVAKCNVYVDDVRHAEAVNRVYNQYFPVDPPARIFLCVAAWPGPFNLEIDCVAQA
jgi:2-iminobutanoate/2-iminopropanoate deaminase